MMNITGFVTLYCQEEVIKSLSMKIYFIMLAHGHRILFIFIISSCQSQIYVQETDRTIIFRDPGPQDTPGPPGHGYHPTPIPVTMSETREVPGPTYIETTTSSSSGGIPHTI